jgi:hypothetical protein
MRHRQQALDLTLRRRTKDRGSRAAAVAVFVLRKRLEAASRKAEKQSVSQGELAVVISNTN